VLVPRTWVARARVHQVFLGAHFLRSFFSLCNEQQTDKINLLHDLS